MTDKNLIFIVSQPRSGSTLLQALLSNNEYIGTVSEPWLLLPYLSIENTNISNSIYNSRLAAEGIKDFYSKIGKSGYFSDLSSFLLKQYSKILKNNEKYILDKTPRYYEILNEIITIFPNAKIIILKRNPLDVLNSIIDTWIKKDIKKIYEYYRDILYAPFLIQDFVEKNNNNPNIKQLRYEDIVTKTEETIKDLYNWLGIVFKPEYLNYKNNKKYLGLMGDKKNVEKNSEVIKHNTGKWRNKLLNSTWKNFFLGYANYLQKDFLISYGNYNNIPAKKTFYFKIFIDKGRCYKNMFCITRKKLIKYYFINKLKISPF